MNLIERIKNLFRFKVKITPLGQKQYLIYCEDDEEDIIGIHHQLIAKDKGWT